MSSLFGGGSAPQINFSPTPLFNQTGFGVQGGNIYQSPTLQGQISGLQSTFGQQASALGGLAQTVQPGFSQFRKAGLEDITNAFQSNLSNLKQNLSQRGIAGSSFANDQISNAYATEAQNKADFEAQSYIEELNAQYQLIQSQYQAASQQFSSAINQTNIESGIAASLISSNNQAAAQIAATNAELQAKAQAGAGSFLGTLLGLGLPGTNAAGGVSGGTLGGSIISGLGSTASSIGASILGMGPFLTGL